MLGEEQEQVFSYVARRGSTTKHQSRASKNFYFVYNIVLRVK